jgi:hypothetical protein
MEKGIVYDKNIYMMSTVKGKSRPQFYQDFFPVFCFSRPVRMIHIKRLGEKTLKSCDTSWKNEAFYQTLFAKN